MKTAIHDVAIIGAGIGGLTAAIALAKRGFDVHVYEAAPALQQVGAGIWVPSNAMQVLADLGLADEVLAHGLALDAIELRDGTEPLQNIDLGPIRERFGFSTVSIHRARLQRILASRVPADRLHLGAACAAVADGAIELAGGGRVQARVIVGADGIHSRVRERIAPGAKLVYSGETTYRGIVAMELAEPRRCVEIWGGPLRAGYSAIAPNEIYWFAPMLAEAGAASRAGELAELYAAFPEPMPAILRATDPAHIVRTDLWELAPLRRWSAGNAVLLGDAAHAMTPNLGQGGAQAIEDAWVLADALAAHEQLDAAFAAYERARRKRTKRIATLSRRLGRMSHIANRLVAWARNVAFKHAPDWIAKRSLDELYRVEFLH